MKRLLVVSSISLWLAAAPVGLCAPSFKAAVENYKAGKYASALEDFKYFKASSPNNVLTRYYLALCHQAMNHTSDARAEYEWVSRYGDPTLKSHAATGLAQLSSMRSVSTATRVPTSGGNSVTPMPPSARVGSKVKKILEFYADW